MSNYQEWYHIVLTTYGAWLYGDPRGFRTRHHREHVEGDYKSPPPSGRYDVLETKSRESLKHRPVVLTVSQRETVGQALCRHLQSLGSRVDCLSVSGQHVHLCAYMPSPLVREWVGAAKRHAWYALRELGWRKKLWAKRCKVDPIRDQRHLNNARAYIIRHGEEGAWVWESPRAATRGRWSAGRDDGMIGTGTQ